MVGSRARLVRGAAVVTAIATLGGVGASAFGYRIRSGDTVSALAVRFGVSQRALVAANHLANPNLIYTGETLVIPSGPTTTTAVPSLADGAAHTAASASSLPVAHGPTGALSAPATTTTTTTTVAPVIPPDPRSPGPLAPVVVPPSGAPIYPSDLLTSPQRLALAPIFRYWARMYGVSAGLLESVGWMESGWRTTAVSRTGAIGVCQIEPRTAAFVSSQLLSLSTTLDATLADANIHMAAAYLSWLLQQTHGDIATALGGYYQGLMDLVAKGPRVSTRRYVSGVGALWAVFRSG